MKTKHHSGLFITLLVIFLFSFIFDDIAFSFLDKIKNPLFDMFFGWITHFGNIFVVLILLTSLFLWTEKKREWIPALWASYVFGIALSVTMKFLIQRPRPFFEIFYPAVNWSSYSFPSGHAMAAFAAIPILDKEFPKLKWFWIFFAILAAVSRVYLGYHYLSDVLFGALLGYSIGWVFMEIEIRYKVFKRWIFSR